MKIICIILAMLPILSFGQTKIGIGGKVGLNIPSFTVLTEGSENAPGLIAGLTTDIGSDKSGFVGEILFNSVGVTGRDNNADIQYISVPLMFRRSLGPVFKAVVGPEFSFLTNSRLTTDGDTYNADFVTKDFNFGIGGGFRISPFPALFLDLRANIGLTKVYDISDTKLTKFHLALGFIF